MTTDDRWPCLLRPEELPPVPASIEWIEADQNPFGIRVLDIRPLTWTVTSTTANKAIADRFLAGRKATGRELAEHPDQMVGIACQLTYPLVVKPAIRPLFLAPVMEDKWDVFLERSLVRVARSWTGAVVFVGYLRSDPAREGEVRVETLEASKAEESFDAEQALRDFDFVMKAYVLGLAVPNAVPVAVQNQDVESIALQSYSVHGRRATYATFDETLPGSATSPTELVQEP